MEDCFFISLTTLRIKHKVFLISLPARAPSPPQAAEPQDALRRVNRSTEGSALRAVIADPCLLTLQQQQYNKFHHTYLDLLQPPSASLPTQPSEYLTPAQGWDLGVLLTVPHSLPSKAHVYRQFLETHGSTFVRWVLRLFSSTY